MKTAHRLAALAAGTALVLTPISALAESTNAQDPSGDAPKVADITKLKVRHGQHRITGTLVIPDLKVKKLAGTQLQIKTKGKKKVYLAYVARGRKGKVTWKGLAWGSTHDPGNQIQLPCSGIKTPTTATTVRISVPKSCLTRTGPNKKVKAKAKILARVGPGHDSWDEVTKYSAYVRRG